MKLFKQNSICTNVIVFILLFVFEDFNNSNYIILTNMKL